MRSKQGGLALGLVGVAAVMAMGAAAPIGETYDQRIARRIATLDQKTYEIHRRCYGWQEGIYQLLNRLLPYVAQQDARKLEDLIVRYGPKEMYGTNEGFLNEHPAAFDRKAGDQAWGKGHLEWGAQALQPPDKQYEYYVNYGFNQPPPDCAAAETRIEAVRTLVWNDEFSRELYGKAFIPPYDPR